MSYFRVTTLDDTLGYYVWADNAKHAVRKVEDLFGGLPPQRTIVNAIEGEVVPEGDDVLDEPDIERELRTDGTEVEDSI